jgi:hypothetical protein
MRTTLCLLVCALAVRQPPERGDWLLLPQLARGQELVYTGTFTEQSLIPGVQYEHAYRIDLTALVLDAGKDKFDLALLTTVGAQETKQGPKTKAPTAASVRLELAALEKQGKLRPVGVATLHPPVEGPPTAEAGIFVEVPRTRVGIGWWWEVNDEGRPPRTWRVDGTEVVNNVKCVKLVGLQQSEDWGTGRADSVAWQRRDTVWVAPQQGVVSKYERILERRAAAREVVTHRSILRLEQVSGLTYQGPVFEARVAEIKQARKFRDDAEPGLRDPEKYKAVLETMQKRIKQYCDLEPPTSYRKAVEQVQKRIEAALRGESVPDPQATAGGEVRRIAIGERVPDFVCTDLLTHKTERLQRVLGKPVLVFFYNPATEIGRQALSYARGLTERFPGEVSILALAVTDDLELVEKQRKEMKLPFAVLDGSGMHQTFGVDGLPRLVVLDGDGVLRLGTTGWGTHTAAELTEQIQKCKKK